MNDGSTLTIVSTADFSPASLASFEQAAPGATLRQFPHAAAEEVPAAVLAQADVYYAWGKPPTREVAPRLRWVHTHFAGVDSIIDAPIFSGGDVILTNTAGVHAINMAEYTLMMMLALAHRLPRAFHMMQDRRWDDKRPSAYMPAELRGATLGLIGYGKIGQEIARLAQAFGMKVMVCRRSPSLSNRLPEGITFVPHDRIDALMRQSDFVVLVVPLTPETRNIVDAAALGHMKPSAYLINIGRGATVEEPALIDALRERRIAGAALDVFAEEPLPSDSLLWRLENVILTPHIAGLTPNYESRAAAVFAENLRRFVAGEPLVNQVDFARGY
jgi:phosphoglycerate dehydrogenase-like enzyme